ncbi:glycosyltransferase family 4 protein [Candidatus Pacearchaeota archaeon]|nr:glycosyltransferase family 4 protein [Candidatus Pacearchaeota archaeon]
MILHPLPSRVNQRADQLAKYLALRGHNIHLVLWDVPYPITWKNVKYNFANSLKYNFEKKGNVNVHKVRRLPFFFPLINKPLFRSQLKKMYKKYDINVVVSESYINEAEPPEGPALFYDFVDDHEAYAKFYGSFLYRIAFKILNVHKSVTNQIKRSKAVVSVSDMLKDYAKKYNKNSFKLTNGVESWPLNHNFNPDEYNFGKHSLVYVSGFDHWSNLPNLLHAVNSARKKIPDIQLILVGDGFQIPEGKKIVEELGLEKNVKFFGKIKDRKKLFKIIQGCNVCLNLSEKNPRQDSASSVKIFEYSALCKPIISTRLSEIEKLNFSNVIFYDEGDNKHLINAILKSFKKKIDKNKVKRFVQKYTWEEIAKQFEEIIYKFK